jgi:nitroreductase
MIEQIKTRRSIRNYNDKLVEDDKIMELLESARLAPSGSNTQPWDFIIVKSKEMKEKVADVCHHQKWMSDAAVQIVCTADICARLQEGVGEPLEEDSPQFELKQSIRDTAIAAEHIVLEATELGLASCWVAWFVQDDIRPVLNIPSDKYVVCVITIGYTDEVPNPRPRKSIEQILHYEKW